MIKILIASFLLSRFDFHQKYQKKFILIFLQNNISTAMIFDAVLLIGIVFGVQFLQTKYPNILFFPKGAVMFLPPEQTNEPKQKKKKQKQGNEISVMKIDYEKVKDYPYGTELSRILMTILSLAIFIVVRVIINIFFREDSHVAFYILVLIIAYTLKQGVNIFFLTNYNRKVCIFIAFGVNLLFFFLYLFLQKYEGIYDQSIKRATYDYAKHLEIMFNRKFPFISDKLILGIVCFINFFVVLAIIPSIIKFGNWYAKTLKELYHQQDEENKIPAVRRVDGEERDERQQQAQLKKQAKSILWKLNFYLAFMLFLIIVSHKYFLAFAHQIQIDIIRTSCVCVCCYSICTTMSSAIEFNGSFAYKYVMEYFNEQSKQKRDELKKKIVSYIYYIWYHYFQFISRLLFPVLIFMLVLTWQYLFLESEGMGSVVKENTVNTDISCSIQTNHLEVLENLYKCPVNTTLPSNDEQKFMLNGMLETIPQDMGTTRIQQNMIKYSILTKGIMLEFSDNLFWYTSISIYMMTVLYILFLRKTVFDL